MRRAGRRQGLAALLALAVVVLLTLFVGPARGDAARPAPAGTAVVGHAHHPPAVPLRPPVPAGMAPATAVAVVPAAAGRTATSTPLVHRAGTRQRGRAPPR